MTRHNSETCSMSFGLWAQRSPDYSVLANITRFCRSYADLTKR
jgi:hypothetical protein